jgi:hypothetical protein
LNASPPEIEVRSEYSWSRASTSSFVRGIPDSR